MVFFCKESTSVGNGQVFVGFAAPRFACLLLQILLLDLFYLIHIESWPSHIPPQVLSQILVSHSQVRLQAHPLSEPPSRLLRFCPPRLQPNQRPPMSSQIHYKIMNQFKERCRKQMERLEKVPAYVGSDACLERFWREHKREEQAFEVWCKFLEWRGSFSWEGQSQKYLYLGKTHKGDSVILIRAKNIDVQNIDVRKQIAEIITVIQPLLIRGSSLIFIYDRNGLDTLLPSLPLIDAVKQTSKRLLQFYQSVIEKVILVKPSLALRVGMRALRPYLGKAGERVVLGGSLQKVLKEIGLQEGGKL